MFGVIIKWHRMVSVETFSSCFDSNAKKGKLRGRSLVIWMRSSIPICERLENEHSLTAVLHGKVLIAGSNAQTAGEASRNAKYFCSRYSHCLRKIIFLILFDEFFSPDAI